MEKPVLERQPGPFCIQVELTEGCSIQCKFCGIQGIREKPGGYKFMDPETARLLARKIAEEVDWNPRIEFAMHGEPSLNPNRFQIIGIFRDHLPKAYMLMLSNGSGFCGGSSTNITRRINGAFDAGLNTLAIEEYGHAPFHETIKKGYKGPLQAMFYPSQKEANPHSRKHHSVKQLVYVADIFTETRGTHSHINTHCGTGSPPVSTHHGKRCAKPFRELSVRWDGQIALCCNDWRGTFNCGSINELRSLDEIWNGPGFDAARRELYLGNRQNIPCCSGCNETSYRSGLIPDKLGKYRCKEPDKQSRGTLVAYKLFAPMTKPVLRPWEK